MGTSQEVTAGTRVLIIVLFTAIIAALAKALTGSIIPSDPRHALIFQNALLLIVLGSALTERHFTKPADSLINSLMGLITLLSVYQTAPRAAWLVTIAFCAIVLLISGVCVAASAGEPRSEWQNHLSQITYRPAVLLGQSRVFFSVVFIAGLSFFYSVQDRLTIALVIFWGAYLVIWPLRLPEYLSGWFTQNRDTSGSLGRIIRIDNPNILRVALDPGVTWTASVPHICVLPDQKSYWVLPLYSTFSEGGLIGTGLVTNQLDDHKRRGVGLYKPNSNEAKAGTARASQTVGWDSDSVLIGSVTAGSSISALRFEVLPDSRCHAGMLVWSLVGGERVYYQVNSALTSEETLSSNRIGVQLAVATQLGHLKDDEGFSRSTWLPPMNAPVFAVTAEQSSPATAIIDGDLTLGFLPHTEIAFGGPFERDFNFHTAIIGATGTGKTELAFDIIRHALANNINVICIDLTAQYNERLEDLDPQDLSVSAEDSIKLEEKLFAVETGQYGAGQEKKTLNSFVYELEQSVRESLSDFFCSDSQGRLGLIRLEEISNTKATLRITELFMSQLLRIAREERSRFQNTLVVVEEAHTVMPEAGTMGLGDYESRGLVGKIAQIALQGRKYGVGLLVLAQRTATVSKTVLTQCNSVIAFRCFDDTSLSFLRNIFGPEHVELIPNLENFSAVAIGPWVRSDGPVVFQVPYDESKKRYS